MEITNRSFIVKFHIKNITKKSYQGSYDYKASIHIQVGNKHKIISTFERTVDNIEQFQSLIEERVKKLISKIRV